jgi:hypothetical protein
MNTHNVKDIKRSNSQDSISEKFTDADKEEPKQTTSAEQAAACDIELDEEDGYSVVRAYD